MPGSDTGSGGRPSFELEECERRIDSYSACLDELPAACVIAVVVVEALKVRHLEPDPRIWVRSAKNSSVENL